MWFVGMVADRITLGRYFRNAICRHGQLTGIGLEIPAL